MKDVVSIIVPTYNVEDYLEECLDSILSQSYRKIEVICVDDGSTDKCGNILDVYAKKDDRIKVFHRENGGYGKAMNFGISCATGEYVGIVEPDDYILPNMIEELICIAKQNDLDFVKSNFRRFYGNATNRLFEDVPLTNLNFYNRVICPSDEIQVFSLVMNIWTGLYKMSFLKENKIMFNTTPGASFQDNGFWFVSMICAKRVAFVDKYYYMNRRDNPNSSVKGTEKAFCVIEEFEFIENELRLRNVYEQYKELFVKYKILGLIAAYNRSSSEHKMKFIISASKEINRHIDAGEVNSMLYGPVQWKKLNKIAFSPIDFFVEDISGIRNNNSDSELNEKIAKLKNEIVNLSDIKYSNNMKNEEKVKISVIIPVYNDELFIDECLESIVSQTLDEIEIICIDDGSTDNSVEKLLAWKNKDKRIKIICQANAGSGAARNKGIECAKGDYLCFMDGDDWYPSNNVLETLFNTAKQKNIDIVGGGIEAYKNGEKMESPDYYEFENEEYVTYDNVQIDYGYTRYIYSKHILEDVGFPTYVRYQDPIFFVEVLHKAKQFYTIKKVVYAYRKPIVKKKFNEKQCQDILLALSEEYRFAMTYNYDILKQTVAHRIVDEYLYLFAPYLCKNSQKVCGAFRTLLLNIDDELKTIIISKLFEYVSKNIEIPYRRLVDSGFSQQKYNELKAKEENTQKMYLRAQYELDNIRASFSYRLAMKFTAIPRFIRRKRSK